MSGAGITRRTVLGGLGGAAALGALRPAAAGSALEPEFRIRTITAGIGLDAATDRDAVERALRFLDGARETFTAAGHTVQTVRIATQPLDEWLADWDGPDAIGSLQPLDWIATEAGMPFSIGPVRPPDDPGAFGAWAARLVRETDTLSFTVPVTDDAGQVDSGACAAAAAAIAGIATARPGGEGNFRFAATAFCPPGTPFFPAAWHRGEPAFALGLESPRLLTSVFREARKGGMADAAERLSARLDERLRPLESLARELADRTGWRYLGIDTSPAPGIDASIGEAIETLTGAPFGSPSTLAACAAITGTLQALTVRTCGYSGLMLPVLEDTVLAARAAEGRYGVAELLLYSSVCGTGLDVVPLPGDTPVSALTAAITDVAALAARYRKPLSARLFPVPGKAAGDWVRFDNPYLTDAVVMPLDPNRPTPATGDSA